MPSVLQDLRYALRTLLKRPGFTIAVVLTLGLGIGADTAIFTVVKGVLLQPLPYQDADRLTLIWGRMSATEVDKAPLSGLDLLDLRERATQFTDIAAASGFDTTLSGDFEAESIHLGWATANLFDVLGVEPLIGRTFQPSDEQNLDPREAFLPGTTPPPTVAILSYELWERRYGRDPEVLGRSIQVSGQPMTIVGVAPRGFKLYLPAEAAMGEDPDLWGAIPFDLSVGARDQQWLTLVGRLDEGATLGQAQAQADAIAAQFRTENQFHANVGMEIDVVPMLDDVVGHVEPVLLALLGAVGCVLLIACANVANLLLVRGQSRRRELAIRTALGGGRRRIVRQMFTETAVLAVLGGALGLLLAYLGVDLLLTLQPDNLPRLEQISIDAGVLAFVLATTTLAALLFGTLPALSSAKVDLSESLSERSVGGDNAGSHRIRSALVVAEVALSLVLLVGAGLMLRSFARLLEIEPGFEPEGALTFNVAPTFMTPDPERAYALHEQLVERIAALPGVEAVGAVTPLPLAGGGQFWFGPYALHEASDEEWSRNEVDYKIALPGILPALGTRLVAGRALTAADNRMDAAPVVLVDERMAARAWPGESPLGKRIMVMKPRVGETNFERYWAEVVGVVENVRYDDIRHDSREAIYFPFSAWSFTAMGYVVRTAVDPLSLSAAVRDVVRDVDTDIPLPTLVPLRQYVDDALASSRFALVLIGLFGAVALVLSAIGLYGVVSYSVRERTREIAVRVTFGAVRAQIVRLVLIEGLVLTATGIGVGLLGSILLTRLIASLLFGVSATDPMTFGLITALLTMVATVACLIPAHRATRVDPLEALRSE